MTANLTAAQLVERLRAHGLPAERVHAVVVVPLAGGRVLVIPHASAQRFPGYLIEVYRNGADETFAAKTVYSNAVLPRAVKELASQIDPAITPEPAPEPRAVVERLAALTVPPPRRKR